MLSIGTFAHLGHISVRMLRHYDAIGLLKPARIDPRTGYRFYDSGQLERLSRIQLLKTYRFSLSEIAGLLTADAPTRASALSEKRIALYREMASLQRVLRLMGQTIEQEETDMKIFSESVRYQNQTAESFRSKTKVFVTYAIAASILILKGVSMSWLTVLRMMQVKFQRFIIVIKIFHDKIFFIGYKIFF